MLDAHATSYVGPNVVVQVWSRKNAVVRIGKFCSVAANVKFVIDGNHPLECMSTYPFDRLWPELPATNWGKSDPVVGNDVWIAQDVTIYSGVTIGDGAVVAGQSVVVKDVPPYAVVAGNPATIVKYRFPSHIVRQLLLVRWWDLDLDIIRRRLAPLNGDIEGVIDVCLSIKKLPQDIARSIAADIIASRFDVRCKMTSDINEHLPTLRDIATAAADSNGLPASATRGLHVTELGVRGAVSSYAFAHVMALRCRYIPVRLVLVDLHGSAGIDELLAVCADAGVNAVFKKADSVAVEKEPTDVLFIDTWHVYGHLKRELNAWHAHVAKYIVLHDTEIDSVSGESIRNGWDVVAQSAASGYPVEELQCGLQKAIDEFLDCHPQWHVVATYTNNNGLTVIKRK